MTAVERDDPSIISLLMKCGAHFAKADSKQVAEMVSSATKSGVTKKLESLKMAGADLNVPDELHQTPLHKVSWN